MIIPVFNDAANLDCCLTGLFASSYNNFECLVIDDGSTDASAAVARRYPVNLVQRRNSGPAAARNDGARRAGGKILFFIDADVLCHKDTLEKVAGAFKSCDVDAVFGSYDDEPAQEHFISQFKNLYHHFTHQNARQQAHTFWAGCGAVKRDLFLTLGGFDTQYRKPMIEDIELGYRMSRQGYRIRLIKDLQVKHLKKWTLVQLIKTDLFHRGIPWTILILKNKQFQNDLNVSSGQRLCVALVFSLLLSFVLPLPCALLYSIVVIAGIVGLNLKLYQFFWQKRGPRFALKAVLPHLLYYFYSGISFIIGNIKYYMTSRRMCSRSDKKIE